jgi:hypothetical protein
MKLLFAGKWMELENIMLSEVSQAQKIKGCMLFLICGNYNYNLNVYIEAYMILYIYICTMAERTKLY